MLRDAPSTIRPGPTPRGAAPPAAVAGMTLVELLAAMAIFLGLAGMVMQVLGGGLDLWSSGEKSRQSREQGSVLLDLLERELREMAVPPPGGTGEPRIKLVCDLISQDPDGDGHFDFSSQRLLMVRNVIEQRTHPMLREAGYRGGLGAFYEGQGVDWVGDLDPLATEEELAQFEEQEAPFFLATEGLAEVLFIAYPDDRREYEGRLVLWRALRSPIGGAGSLFQSLDSPSGFLDEAIPMEVVADNLLHLGFEFFDGQTYELSSDSGSGGPSPTWDSTRGILEPGEGGRSFRHGVGPQSLRDPEDDVFPRAIRIVVVVEAPPEESFEAELLDEIGLAERGETARVLNGKFLEEREPPVLARLGHEWVELGDATSGGIALRRRGLLGTQPSPHPAGTKLIVGRRYERIVRIPVARDPAPRTGRDG